jgi:hypothetical protein
MCRAHRLVALTEMQGACSADEESEAGDRGGKRCERGIGLVLITPHEWFKAGPCTDPSPDQSMA